MNAKILKDVKFPMILDVFDLCTPELQKKLTPIRAKYKVRGYITFWRSLVAYFFIVNAKVLT